MYPIVVAPNSVLSTKTEEVSFFGAKLEKIVSAMTETLLAQKDPEGVGLAANQVGLSLKLFLARFDTKKSSPIHVFINPTIVNHSEQLQPSETDKHASLEGCLSIPKFYGLVKRYATITLEYQIPKDRNYDQLVTKVDTFTGFAAVVLQHELDHLAGHLFVERILEQKGRLYKITGRDKRGKEVWEEVELG